MEQAVDTGALSGSRGHCVGAWTRVRLRVLVPASACEGFSLWTHLSPLPPPQSAVLALSRLQAQVGAGPWIPAFLLRVWCFLGPTLGVPGWGTAVVGLPSLVPAFPLLSEGGGRGSHGELGSAAWSARVRSCQRCGNAETWLTCCGCLSLPPRCRCGVWTPVLPDPS